MEIEPFGGAQRRLEDGEDLRVGPTWVSCDVWVLAWCPFECPGRKGCRGYARWDRYDEAPDGVWGDLTG